MSDLINRLRQAAATGKPDGWNMLATSEWGDAADMIERLQSEAKHWKANHDNQVAKAALLAQRPDLPVDRIPAYREMERLQTIEAAAKNLINVKGRHHSEQAYQRLVEVTSSAPDASVSRPGQ